jgi:hypothetical protein
MFLHTVRSVGDIVHSGASVVEDVDTLFFLLGWALCESHKNYEGTHYAERLFLHPVRSAGHVVRSGVSGA